MYRSIPLAFVAAALLSAAPIALDRTAAPGVVMATASAAASVDINVFFTSLSPYGSWIPSSDYNYVWVPSQVAADWSPYTNGHWIYTDEYGWYFESDEPFASIVYHYGRWGFDPLVGWYWVPGTNWAPAWVAWRQDNDDIGWAPLPPQGNGYATDVNITLNIGQVPDHYWRFVPSNQFLAPQLRTVAFTGDTHPDVFRATQPSGFARVQNNVVINNVITLNFVEQQTKQKVTPTRINTVSDPKQASGPGGDKGGKPDGSINAFIASLAPPDKSVKPDKIESPTSITAPTKGQSSQPSNPQDKIGSIGPGMAAASVPTVTNFNGGGNGPGGNGPNGNGSGNNGVATTDRTAMALAVTVRTVRVTGGNGPNGTGNNGVASTGPGGTAACPQDADPKTPGCQTPKGPDATVASLAPAPEIGALPVNPGTSGPGGNGPNATGNGPNGSGPNGNGNGPGGSGPKTGNGPSGNGATNDNGKGTGNNGVATTGPSGGAACPQDADPKTPGCQTPKGPDGAGPAVTLPQVGALPGNGQGPGGNGKGSDSTGGAGGGQNQTGASGNPKGGPAGIGGNGPGGNGPSGGPGGGNASTGGNGSGGDGGKPAGANNFAQGNGPAGNGGGGGAPGGNGGGNPGKGGPTVTAPGGDTGKCVDTDPKTPGCQPAPTK